MARSARSGAKPGLNHAPMDAEAALDFNSADRVAGVSGTNAESAGILAHLEAGSSRVPDEESEGRGYAVIDCAGSGRKAAERRREQETLFQEVITPELRRAILEQITRSAAQGDLRAAAFLFDRLYGKPTGVPRNAPPDMEDAEERRPDLSRLTDEELETLASLLQKASDPDRPPADHDDNPAGAVVETLSS